MLVGLRYLQMDSSAAEYILELQEEGHKKVLAVLKNLHDDGMLTDTAWIHCEAVAHDLFGTVMSEIRDRLAGH